MKLSDIKPKVRKGQVWRKKSNGILLLITGGARSKFGQNCFHTKRFDNPKQGSHSIGEKEIWRFYELV